MAEIMASHISPSFKFGMIGSQAEVTMSAVISAAGINSHSSTGSSSSPPRQPASDAASILSVISIAIIFLSNIACLRSLALFRGNVAVIVVLLLDSKDYVSDSFSKMGH